MERKLLLLGLLRIQEMYGYQLNEFIESHLSMGVYLKKPTAYHLLKKMAKEGWVTFSEDRAGNRPPRRVYAITTEGEAAFQNMLRESLAEYKPAEFQSDISLMFVDAIPPDEVLPLLQNRRSAVEELCHLATTHHQGKGSFQMMIEHQTRHLSAELDWLDEVIERVEETIS